MAPFTQTASKMNATRLLSEIWAINREKNCSSARSPVPRPLGTVALDSAGALLEKHEHLLLLAGSWQRGTATEFSDIDLLCIVNDVAAMRNMVTELGYSPDLARFQIVRVALCDRPSIAVRVLTQASLSNLYKSPEAIFSWRESPTTSVTSLEEYRARIDGHVSVHPWNEQCLQGGYSRELVRFDYDTNLPVATTEVSMLISGVRVSSFGIDDNVRRTLWSTFGLGDKRTVVEKHPMYGVLADPRRHSTTSESADHSSAGS